MTQPIHPMLERVARKIHEGLGESWAYSNYGGDEWNDCREELCRAARAAVQALMEPDEGMVEAGEDAMIYPDGNFVRNQAEMVFQAMLRPLIEGEGRQPVPGVYRDGQGER